MSERGLTRDDMIAAMQDIRLPAEAPGGLIADLAVAIGLGLLVALLFSAVLPLVTRRQQPPRPPTAEESMGRLDGLPEDMRVIGLLHILRSHDPARAREFTEELYRKGPLPDAERLVASIRGISNA
ncbi:hypothetical protein [Algicella marina]|uniref:Uncharacterized protein n=1 Tax=Algicella marina TaxID=2683284 RepID=A0A6P1T0S9_9RHOB|nr:hypothetical protein [Algicella marina]QHQ36514.1 hypothetical protein GO499_15705 [Algicella marina]